MMNSFKFGVIFFNVLYAGNNQASQNSSCGIDLNSESAVHTGRAAIESYPWMGILYYPIEKNRFTTTVVLVTRQMVIAAANEIDKLPKWDFRAKSRVVLGGKCGQKEIRVRDYTFHPEYNQFSISALAMVQLEIDHIKYELRPICPPPPHFIKPQFLAMTISASCKNPKLKIYDMEYVNIKTCKLFYRKSGLDQESIWPTHTTCAQSTSGGRCLWRSGTVLAIKQDGRWRLLGFSVYGPGCGAPARFLDYGMYHTWIRRSIISMGRPAVSRLADNHIVLRRTYSNLQRFGPCDPEESKVELYIDKVAIIHEKRQFSAKYNLSLYASVEYSCIVFKAMALNDTYDGSQEVTCLPKIRLKRWCPNPASICYGFEQIEIQLYVEINFDHSLVFQVSAYGKESQIIAPSVVMEIGNKYAEYAVIQNYSVILKFLKDNERDANHYWFYLDRIAMAETFTKRITIIKPNRPQLG